MQAVVRLFSLSCVFLLVSQLTAQQYFPVKVNNQWGLIDVDGSVAIPPVYDAIGSFKEFGYAVMQRNEKVGLLGNGGKEVIRPLYQDIKVLDSTLVAVMENQEWKVINLQGDLVLPKGYQRIRVLKPGLLAYRVDGKWGAVNGQGKAVLPNAYDDISVLEGQYLQTQLKGKKGLSTLSGNIIIKDNADEIRVYNSDLFFYSKDRLWGAVNQKGREKISPKFTSYRAMGPHFIKLMDHDKISVFSLDCQKLIAGRNFDDFYPFSESYIISKRNRRLGLIDKCGAEIIPTLYNEIQSFNRGLFRVNFEGVWGVVDQTNETIIPIAYHYISPSQGAVSVVKQGDFFGMVNITGETVVPVEFAKIDWTAKQAKAYKVPKDNAQDSLSVFNFDEDGKLSHNDNFNQHFQINISGATNRTNNNEETQDELEYLLDAFEWFYSPESDRWGLRKLSDGSVQIEPQFDYIQVEKDLGLTVVGIWKPNDYEFERTSFRYEMIFGIVLNNLGILVTELNFIDIQLDDFRKNTSVARVVFPNGRYGLIDPLGRVMKSDLAYIGSFNDGVARMSAAGHISAKRNTTLDLGTLGSYLNSLMTPSYMVDYTQYDQLFQKEAKVVCEDCVWGYIDTAGQVSVTARYSFAYDMVNQVGIVEENGKWGMVNKNGAQLIPCQYDGVQFLESTDNRMVKVYIEEPKYGLIDTLGQLAVNAIYEEIGSFSDNRLAVKRAGKWGYVNQDGVEVIPCRFEEVLDFSEGLAAVKISGLWGYVDQDGAIVIPATYRRASQFNQGLAWAYIDQGYGYINRENTFVIPPKFDRAFDFQEGVARVVIEGDYGLIDSNGDFLVKTRFGEIQAFDQHGLAIVRMGKDRVRYGIINRNGQVITNDEFKSIEPFLEGLAAVKTKNGHGYINTSGRIVIPCKYSKAGPFSEGRASVQMNGKCGYIDANGELIIPFEYSRCREFSGGRAVVYRGVDKAGILDLEGNELVAPSLDRLLDFNEGRGLMRDNNSYRFYYITEQTNLYDGFYDKASAFHHGIAVVQVNGKWGIINQKGIEIVPPKYDAIENFENGFAKVKIQGYNGLSNLNGEMIIKPDYEFITYAGEGLFRVEQGDKIGYFDSAGKWVWDLTK